MDARLALVIGVVVLALAAPAGASAATFCVHSPAGCVGTAANQTAITTNSSAGGLIILDIQEPTTTLSDLRVHHKTAAPNATGIRLAGDATDILVTNQGIAGQFDGIRMEGASPTID